MGRASHSKIWSSELVFREWRANPKDFPSKGEGVAEVTEITKITEITEVAESAFIADKRQSCALFYGFHVPKWERAAFVASQQLL